MLSVEDTVYPSPGEGPGTERVECGMWEAGFWSWPASVLPHTSQINGNHLVSG